MYREAGAGESCTVSRAVSSKIAVARCGNREVTHGMRPELGRGVGREVHRGSVA